MAATVPPDQLREFALSVAAEYGITSAPSLGNPEFTAAVVFDRSRAAGTPKARLAYLFPNRHSAQIVLRLRPDLSDSERHRALELIREASTKRRRASRLQGPRHPGALLPAQGRQLRRLRGAGRRRRALPGAVDALWVLLGVAVVVMALALLARLPLAAAPPAARPGPRRRRAHLRPLRAVRRLADDGLDRRPADPDRPRRRLRDPVPGPLRRGGRGGPGGRRRGRRAAAARRADHRHGVPRHRWRASSPCFSRRPRWFAASACCWSSASPSLLGLPSLPASRR